jgi:hypothetical protein
VRFFGAGEAEGDLRELMRTIRTRESVPGEVNLGGTLEHETVLTTLVHLERFWDSTPPARGAERSAVLSRVTVVPGLPNILRCLELISSGAPLDPQNFAEQETWVTCDRSDGGYGALVPRVRDSFDYDPLTGDRSGTGDWLRIGSLLALCEENAETWRLGIVRRITDDGSEQRRVGIEVLAGSAMVIKLAPVSGPRAGEPERRRSAVLLSSTPHDDKEVLVLMRAGHFSTRQSVALQLGDKHCLLQAAELLEAGEDFDCVRYTLLPS